MLRRKIESKLYDYYSNKDSRILVINGARQIGKSFIVRETAKKVFEHYVEVNLKDDFDGLKLFSTVKTVSDFYIQLSALYGNNLDSLDNTIIFLDEIQVYPHILSLLKALKLDNKYRYIASGSLLGITLRHTFIPMGSIEEVKMYPMDFEEFLWANGTGADVITYLKNCYSEESVISDSVHKVVFQRFREYLITGGLPDAVKTFVEEKNVFKIRSIQSEILQYYKDDSSQYDMLHSLSIRRVYDLIQSYMGNKVKRVVYSEIDHKVNSNLSSYQEEFDYLISSGCALGVRAVSNPVFPLNESQSKNLIKLYYNDVGLLTNLLYSYNVSAVLNEDKVINLGSVYETVVAMELSAHGHDLYYFDSKKTGEVDFLINDYNLLSVMPVEVKSGRDQYNFRALPRLVDTNGAYKLKKGVVLGNKNIIAKTDNILTLPVYLVMFI